MMLRVWSVLVELEISELDVTSTVFDMAWIRDAAGLERKPLCISAGLFLNAFCHKVIAQCACSDKWCACWLVSSPWRGGISVLKEQQVHLISRNRMSYTRLSMPRGAVCLHRSLCLSGGGPPFHYSTSGCSFFVCRGAGAQVCVSVYVV